MALALLPNNGMTFTENQHGTAVLEKLRSQRDQVRCCDVILHVAAKQFHAHRCVLAACSPYFDSIFKASKTVKEQLTISSQDAEVFRCLLAYMYTGTVVVDKTNVAELLRLANKLLIAKLKEHCAEYLERYLDNTNCLTVRDMATKFSLEALEKTTGTYIKLHISEIIEGEEILDLIHNKLEDFIKNLTWQLAEDQTLLLVTRWVDHDPEARERNLRSLLTWVEWSRVDLDTSINLAQSHSLYSRSRLARFFLLEALNNNCLLPSDLLASYYKLKTKFCQPTETAVDNESFLSMAISTAIDELQDNETLANAARTLDNITNDQNMHFLNHHINAQEKEEFSHFNLCRSVLNEDIHNSQTNLDFPHTSSTIHPQTSEDSVEGNSSIEDKKKPSLSENHNHFDKKGMSENHSHFAQLPVWHQDTNVYTQEESLSSDSSHLYPRQFYGQGFEAKGSSAEAYNTRIDCKIGSSENYNTRVGSSQQMYSPRESLSKTKAGFSSAMSYYVSNYNPDNDVTISGDDQSTQSFPYDEGINQGINFYSSRTADGKDSTQMLLGSQNQNEGAYNKSYYQDNSSTYQDESSTYQDNSSVNQTANCLQQNIYYNDNSSDTQVSNCPQDMTIQHQFSSAKIVKEQTETQFTHLNDKENSESQFINSEKNDFVTQFSHQDSQSQFCSQHSMISNRLDNLEEDTASHNLSIITEDSVDTSHDTERQKNQSLDIQSYSHYFSSSCNLGDGEVMENNQNIEQPRELFALELPEVKRSFTEEKEIEQDLENNLDDPDDPDCVLDDLYTPDPLDGNTPRQVQFKINRGFLSSNISQSSGLEERSMVNVIGKEQLTALSHPSPVNEDKGGNGENNNNEDVSYDILITNESKINLQDNLEKTNENHRRTSGRNREEKNIETATVETGQKDGSIKKEKSFQTVSVFPDQKECDICNATFQIKKEYFKHMREHFPGPPHQCDTCKSAFQRIYHLLDHRTLHQDLRPFKCTICNFSTNKNCNLKEHMTLHNENKKYKCKTCGEQFSRLQILTTHETKHTNDRPYLCETCGWAGKTKNALLIHTKKHTGDLRRCQYSGCSYTTAKTSHLKEHMARHSNIRKFVCTHCSNEFHTQSKLSRHLLIHKPEKPFKCSLCDYYSARKDRLNTHIKKKHTKKIIEKKSSRKKKAKKRGSSHLDEFENSKSKKKQKAHITKMEFPQKEMFSDLENSNLSLQPQLPGTPPPTTLSEYPHSPTQYSNFPHSSHHPPDDPLLMGQSPDDKTHAAWALGSVSGMSPVTDALPSLQQSPPLHRGIGSSLTYQDTYHSPTYQTSPTSHFEALSPHSSLPFSNGQHNDESPLNFASYMKYN